MATPLFVALVAIEVTDLVFALDSIPAVFGVTRDLFVVFTSNAFAVLGLRALYFLLAGSVDRFAYLKQGIAVLLVFIGTKMLISPFVHLPVWVSLAAIVVVVGGAVAASLWRDRSPARGLEADRRAGAPRTDRCAHDRARQPAGRLRDLLRHRGHHPRPGRDPAGAAQRDRRHRPRRRDRGQPDPRIALLVACAAVGAFLGDNLSYLLGRRFGPRVERRFFRGEKGARRRAWAERSLERYGMPLIVVCRFIPGGRTAVTLCCGIVGYQRRRFVIATVAAGMIWAAYSFFIGRLGGRAFEDKPWAGLLLAFGATIAVSGLIEVIRRIRSARSP